MVEHSAVNRRVASSNLARGAILLLESKTLTKHVTTPGAGEPKDRVHRRTESVGSESRSERQRA